MAPALLEDALPLVQAQNSSMSEAVRLFLVNKFIEGGMPSGTRINDLQLARKLEVSRTPVREALRTLQAIGIIETLPARLTRVVNLSAREFVQAKAVWGSLYGMLLRDTIDRVTNTQITEMTELCNQLVSATDLEAVSITFRFFDTLGSLTDNDFLQETVFAAACRMRLGHHHVAGGVIHYLRLTVEEAQEFLAALIHRDVKTAHHALDKILRIETSATSLFLAGEATG